MKCIFRNVIFRLTLPNPFTKSKKCTKDEKNVKNIDGKVRNFPHEPGIWATFVYIPVKPCYELSDFVKKLINYFEPFNLKLVDDYHISLSKTVILKHHWIQGFMELLKNFLKDIPRFKIHVKGLKVYTNEEKTRTFLSLMVDENCEMLKTIVNQVDLCLKEYNLGKFYEDPLFHLSLLWCPDNKYDEINSILMNLPTKLKEFNFFEFVSYCCCTSGNKNFKFHFQM